MDTPAIVVLSGGLSRSGRIPFFVSNRLDQAYKWYHQNPDTLIIVSGKESLYVDARQEVTDAEKMSQYLQKLGVKESNILKEEHSKDLLSAVYYIKTLLLEKHRISHIRVIGSDFEEEQVRYVFRKVLGHEYHVLFEFVQSQIRSEVLWNFFSYERQGLANTKAMLRKMKTGDHAFLSRMFFDGKLYREKRIGFIRSQVYLGAIGKRRNARAHYSLQRIQQKRQEIFRHYGIAESEHKILMADFWSGRFLNFFGHDEQNTLYSLKFVLYVKDKKTFAHEIRITDLLQKQGCDFIPKITGENIEKAPPWYLYQVVHGTIAGQFSYTYSFNDHFYVTASPDELTSYLKTIRSVKLGTYPLPIWNAKYYRNEITRLHKKIGNSVSEERNQLFSKAVDVFIKESKRFDEVTQYVTHADLHPANIIVSKDKTYLIDFEHICMNSIAFDYGFLYIFSWNSPSFREKLHESFLKTLTPQEQMEFSYIWPLTHLYLLFFLIGFTYQWEYKSGRENAQMARKKLREELRQVIKQITQN